MLPTDELILTAAVEQLSRELERIRASKVLNGPYICRLGEKNPEQVVIFQNNKAVYHYFINHMGGVTYGGLTGATDASSYTVIRKIELAK